MPAGTMRRSAQRTRERILQAAMLNFSQHSYEATRLRDIAADVGVDVALVHRTFGSKEELFASTLEAAFDRRFEEALEAPDMAESLSAGFFESRLDPGGLVDPFEIVVRSLGSDLANPMLRDFVRRRYFQPLAAKLGPQSPERVALILACLGGLTILHDILSIEAFDEAGRGDMQVLLAQVIRHCLHAGDGVDTVQPRRRSRS